MASQEIIRLRALHAQRRAYSPDQERDERGRFSGSGGGGEKSANPAKAGRAPRASSKKEDKDVAKAQKKVEQAQKKLQQAKDGLVKARQALAKVKEQQKAAKATKVTSRAKAKEPVNVGKHLDETKKLNEQAHATKTTSEKIDRHMDSLNKTLNKGQAQELAKGMGMSRTFKTKGAAIQAVREKLHHNLFIANRAAEMSRTGF